MRDFIDVYLSERQRVTAENLTHSSFYGEHGKLIYVNTMFIVQLVFGKGASIYDVRTEGGRGVPSKADIVSNPSKGGFMNLRTRGEGVKKPKIFAAVLNGSLL